MAKLYVMRSSNELQSSEQVPTVQPELQILIELEDTPDITQRELSKRVGIALGLTNVLVRNLTKKGFLRVSQATWKRRLYTLTPEGFSHRIRLMKGYVNRFLHDYNQVRQSLREQLDLLALNSESRIAICGTGEFAELVYLGLREFGIEEFAVFAAYDPRPAKFLGLQINDVTKLDPEHFDWVFIGQLQGTGTIRTQLQDRGVAAERLITFYNG